MHIPDTQYCHTLLSRGLIHLFLYTGDPSIPTHVRYNYPVMLEDNPSVWWKQHGHFFPTLSRFARRYLTTPVTFCPVERLFSVSGQVDTARRTSLSTDTLTLVVFMDEELPFLRKIRADRIVQEVLGT